MSIKDIRWIQRYNHFTKALSQLSAAVTLAEQRDLSFLEKQGLIQAFEFTHELAWKTMKDFLEDRGVTDLFGSKDVTRAAFKLGLIEHGEIWMQMISNRNLTTHTYDEATVSEIFLAVTDEFFSEFVALKTRMENFIQE